jgi:Competence protein CoiA-like family
MFVARTIESEQPVEATNASKQISYICRNCSEAVVFAKGQTKRPHFKHKKGSECAYGLGETWQHLEAKTVILHALRDRGLDASPEVDVLSIDGDRRADVLVWAPQSEPPKPDDERRMAIEVQYSAIDSPNLANRTAAYLAKKVPVIWIPIIDAKKFKSVYRVEGTNLFKVAEYSVPFWVSDIAAMQGHLWVYVPDTKAFWKGWLLPDWRWKELREGYDSEGNSHSSGNYWYRASRTKDLFLEGPYQFGHLKLVRINHKNNKTFNKTSGWKYLVDLIAPDADKVSSSRAEKRERPHIENGRRTGFHTWGDWVKIGDDWKEADLCRVESLPIAP